ncbi:hypothetical protein GGR52DRAFT_545543 [Hypoxylon sp. FL1284]|nr:hypothetical protein GGR52DRAFT_545543 [Hypoxylon sp. FL1284]
MLLTSSQVSVLISSGIVVLCTAALFLSGYVIQQRTLRDLRAAIISNREPRPSPKIYLPDRFKTPTTELDDGTVVALDDPRLGSRRTVDRTGEDGAQVVIVRPSFPDEKQEEQEQRKRPVEPEIEEAADTRSRGEVRGDGDGTAYAQKPMGRAERRRQIKEEIRRLSEGQERVYYQRRLW